MSISIPSGSVALVANSVDVVKDGDALKQVPDNKIFVIDMKANPPKLAATITGGKQPSGLNFSPSGKMALVANRGDNSISVLSVNGTDVKVTDTIAFPDSVAHVMFTPDGKHALARAFPGAQGVGARHQRRQGDLQQGRPADRPVALQRRGDTEQQDRADSDNGNSGASDGNVDTTSVIDLEANPPRIIDRVVVGDGPEGLAMSPKGDLAVAAILRGSNATRRRFSTRRTAASRSSRSTARR